MRPWLLSAALLIACGAAPRVDGIPTDARETRPLKVGALAPDVRLTGLDAAPFSLTEALREAPAIVIFYRGGWCPYCNQQLSRLVALEPKLKALGYQVLAISPDRPEAMRAGYEEFKPGYTLLSDSQMVAAKAFGIAFEVSAGTRALYSVAGIDLEEASGQAHNLLPAPSVFIIGKERRIHFVYSNPDYEVRVPDEALLKAAKAVAASKI